MKKRRSPLTAAELAELQRLAAMDFSNFTEADVREEFIRPIVSLLGYRKNHDYAVDTEEGFSLHRAFVNIGRDRIKLDYLTGIRKQYFWLMEAKSPHGAHQEALPHNDVAQAYFYALHPEVNCRYFVVCNGWLFNLYDRDTLDDNFTPCLSVRHVELPARFLQIDDYLGSTQIITSTKERLLEQIGKVLCAEIALERLDEFCDAVRAVAMKARPKVIEAQRRNSQSGDSGAQSAWNTFVDNARPWEIVETLFSVASTHLDIRDAGHALVRKMESPRGRGDQLLLFEKVFLDDLKPVRFWYYINSVNFLWSLHRSAVTHVNYRHQGQSPAAVVDLLHHYLRLVFSRFQSRPDLRVMTLLEGCAQRFFLRVAFLSPEARATVLNRVEFAKYALPEEEVASLRPHPAAEVIALIEAATLRVCGAFLHECYDESQRKLRTELAHQMLARWIAAAEHVERATAVSYVEIRRELSSTGWGVLAMDGIFSQWDPIMAGTLEIVCGDEPFVRSLPDDIHRLIHHAISIGATGGSMDYERRFGVVPKCNEEERDALRKSFFSLQYRVPAQ